VDCRENEDRCSPKYWYIENLRWLVSEGLNLEEMWLLRDLSKKLPSYESVVRCVRYETELCHLQQGITISVQSLVI
jgi:hypothetical protein